jgi:sulfate adenylyltransferase
LTNSLPKPHGGTLIHRVVNKEQAEQAKKDAERLPKIQVSTEQAADIENIAYGAFSPLEGLMIQNDFENVVKEGRLHSGLPWTLPITLDVARNEITNIRNGDTVALTDGESDFLATLNIEDIYCFDKNELAQHVYGTTSTEHPGVVKTNAMKERLLGGKINLIRESKVTYGDVLFRPADTRRLFEANGWKTVVGFQTRNAPHLGHEYLQRLALSFFDGLFINPVLGKKKTGDYRDEVILDSYKALLANYLNKNKVLLGVLRTEMRYAGPREAIFHATVRKNFGCTHFMVGRDHAGVGKFYGPYAAQEIFANYPDLGISPLLFREVAYCTKCKSLVCEGVCSHPSEEQTKFSATMLRKIILSKDQPPEELMRPEVFAAIKKIENPFVA